MKRSFEQDIQIQIAGRNVDIKEFITIQKTSLKLEDLRFVEKEVQEEIIEKISTIRETIPSDVWMYIFRYVLNKQKDISEIGGLITVCKRWKQVFSDCQLTEATIKKRESIRWLKFLPTLQYLTIRAERCDIPIDYLSNLVSLDICSYGTLHQVWAIQHKPSTTNSFSSCLTKLRSLRLSYSSHIEDEYKLSDKFRPMITYSSMQSFIFLQKLEIVHFSENIDIVIGTLKKLVNLKKLYITRFKDHIPRKHIQQFVNEALQQFESIKLPLLDCLDCGDIQKKYPHIRFRWYEKKNFNIYEGQFGEKNEFEGRGIYSKSYGYKNNVSPRYSRRYEGEFKNGKKEGRGIYYSTKTAKHEIKYDGEWKNNDKEGKGIYYHKNGRYEGEYKNNKKDGLGKAFFFNGDIYDGMWRDGERNGRGIYYFKNGDKYEGEWKYHKRHGRGVLTSFNGSFYDGEWESDMKRGRGKEFEIDVGIYDGEFKNNMKDGRGICHYSDGSEYDGEWKYGGKYERGVTSEIFFPRKMSQISM